MKDTSSNLPKQSMFRGRWWLPSVLLVGLLSLNVILLFVPGARLGDGVHVFYWQRYNNYLYQLQIWILVLVPILAIIGCVFVFRQTERLWYIASLGVVIAFSIFCLIANYLSFFISSYVSPIGTVVFDGHVYHLARYDKWDDPSEYYLGKCDRSGYSCVFHEIYDFFVADPGSPQITVNNHENLILVKMGDDIVYTYDGQKGECTENITLGWCVEPHP
jgi:hypothetical protein